ncbi:MAG: MFS transporter [Pseudonocardiales bacterium]
MTATDAIPSTRRRAPMYGLVSAYLISQIGTAMSALAIPWLVLISTGSAAQTGLVGFAEMAPYVLLQATGGPLADRVGLRHICVVGNSTAALAVGAIPALHAMDMLSLGVLVGLVAVAGAVRGLSDAATSPLVPGTARLGGLDLERAAGLYSAANRTGLLIGMPLAGLLIGATSAPTVVLVDAISFAVAAAMIALFVPAEAAPETVPGAPLTVRGYGGQLGEGLRFLGGNRLLLGLVTMIATSNLFDQALTSVLLPVWVRSRLDDPAALGFIGGAMGIGALAGVLLGAWLGSRLPRWTTYSLGYLLGASPPFAALAFANTLAPVVVVMVLAGVAGGMLNPIIGAVLYERIPAAMQTRVLGTIKASAWIGIPFGSLLGGGLTAAIGLRATLLVMAAAMLITTLAPFVFPSWRTIDRAPEAETVEPSMPRKPG